MCARFLNCPRGESMANRKDRNIMRGARHGRSTEAEARIILDGTVQTPERVKIGSEIHRIAREIGGMDDLEISRERTEIRGADLA